MRLRLSGLSALVATLALAACGTTGQSPDPSNPDAGDANRIGYPTVDAALAGVRARPSISESKSDGWTVFEDKERREVWLFSPSGHAAHPAVVKRTVVRRFGDTGTQTAAMCGTSKTECDRLVAEFDAADKKAAEKARAAQPGIPADRPRSGGRY